MKSCRHEIRGIADGAVPLFLRSPVLCGEIRKKRVAEECCEKKLTRNAHNYDDVLTKIRVSGGTLLSSVSVIG